MDFLRVPFSGGVKGEPKEYQFGGSPTYCRNPKRWFICYMFKHLQLKPVFKSRRWSKRYNRPRAWESFFSFSGVQHLICAQRCATAGCLEVSPGQRWRAWEAGWTTAKHQRILTVVQLKGEPLPKQPMAGPPRPPKSRDGSAYFLASSGDRTSSP